MPVLGRPASLALCHEWLAARHGSEKTFEAMAAALPTADVYGLTWNPESGLNLAGRPVTSTFLNRLRPLRGRRAPPAAPHAAGLALRVPA